MSEIRIHKTGEPDIMEASDERLTLSGPIQIKGAQRAQVGHATDRP